ncbi:MAG TPA: translation initiation factor IF-2 [Persephonella sp.]|nr:translation initiation factor IF-2 [Persephonella sp.]
MSKLKASELAKELGMTYKDLALFTEENLGITIKSPSTKLDEEVVQTIKDMIGISEEPVEEKKQEEKQEEEGKKVFDIHQEWKVPFEDIKEALIMIGFKEDEISNFTVLDDKTIEKLKPALEEVKRRKEEEERKRKEEEEKRKRRRKIVVPKPKFEEKVSVKEKIEEKPQIKEERKEEIVKKEESKPEKKQEVKQEEKQKEPEKEKQVKPKKEEKVKKVHEKKIKPEQEKDKKEEKIERKEEKEEKEDKKKKDKEQKFSVQEAPQEKKSLKEQKEEKAEIEALKKLMGMQSAKKKKSKKKKKQKEETKQEITKQEEEEIKIVEIPELITVRELSELLDLPVNTIMADLLKRGILATVNQTIDPEIAVQIAEEHGFLAELKTEEEVMEKSVKEDLEVVNNEDESENLVERPPVVTVMGHVDHGKTTLLDTIRNTDVAAKEKGGITQHIGAYKIKLDSGKEITFLDTPGHEAFTTLRARGSKVADIAVLVVAADDGVRPQTIEAINHAKSAGLPIIVAINKIDKPGADPERVKRELSQYELIPEEWGGDTIMVPISAKTGENVEELLENILLVAEILELKANPEKPAIGTVIESKLDPKRGPVATVLVQNGTLKRGDYFVAGLTWGKVRAMFDDRGNQVKEATPGTPVEILGFQDVPQAGDRFVVMKSEREARQLAEQRKQKYEEELLAKKAKLRLENLEGAKEVNIILKADVQGSLEAIIKTLEELSDKFEDVSINIVHAGLGAITEGDVMLASASNAIVIGFNVRPDSAARKASEEEGVEIKTYGIIYDIIDELEKALKGMLEPTTREEILGSAEVKAIFRVKGVGTVAGCLVIDGVIRRNAKARLVRDGVVIYDGEVSSLKRYKEDVKEVTKGYECGLTLKDFNDIKPGDIIEAYEIVKEKTEAT